MMASKRECTENGAHYAATKQYKVLVSTNGKNVSHFSLTLEDSNNKSSGTTWVTKSWTEMFFGFGKEITVYINVEKDLGDIVKVKIEEYNGSVQPNSTTPWFCRYVQVKSPSGKFFEFPCYRWLEKREVVIREGSARLPQDDTDIFKKQRQKEHKSGKETFRFVCAMEDDGLSTHLWLYGLPLPHPNPIGTHPTLQFYDDMEPLYSGLGWTQSCKGFPQNLDAKLDELPLDVRFDEDKTSEFNWNVINVLLKGANDKLKSYFQSWDKIAHFEEILANWDFKKTLLVNVMEDWNMDYMFGYQFLNGCNPVMISKCVELPETFPVTHEMVEGSLQRGFTLQQELEEGNIYIADYKILEGLEANKTRKNVQCYLSAPICLLYNNRLDQIVPIAIQLSQKPGERSPIFLPNDNEHDWTLAKMWVKSSDFIVHQLVTHLLKTHLVSEVFEVAMYRQLSTVHPVYKLLIPHVRFTIAINTMARAKLISEDGVFSKTSGISASAMEKLMKRAMETFTYKSMCFPEAIKARGMENTPKYYYKDDGMMIWEAIYSFVDKVIKIYYDSNQTVQKDVEIQKFVKNVNFGMQEVIFDKQDSETKKFPQSLETREELAEYLTAVIFTASAQHAAVNFGQFEWYGCIPNSPSAMRKPPPQEKGTVDLKHIMNTLPDRDCSREVLGTVWALSRFQGKERYLGMYPDKHFTEQPVKEAIMTFRNKLDELTNIIKRRNKGLTMSYCYLSPDQIPNSVAI